MKIREVMTTGVELIEADASVKDSMKRMLEHRITSLIVEKEAKEDQYGIITRRDIIDKVIAKGKNPKEVSVKEVMTKPIMTLSPDTDLLEVAKLMAQKDVRRFPVEEEGKLVGLISNSDVFRAVTLSNL